MSMQVRLYNFSKKNNSTSIPISTDGSVLFNCNTRNLSSITNPIIEITSNDNLSEYNYAYIDLFSRYYFIHDCKWSEGMWTLYLKVDTLATFKRDILNSNQYVLRSTSDYDDDIFDDYYLNKVSAPLQRSGSVYYIGITEPITQEYLPFGIRYKISETSTTGILSNYFQHDYTNGWFVVGVVGNNSVGVVYYAMSCRGFIYFLNKVFTLVPSGMTDVSTGVAQAIFDPIKYITMCKWYPAVVGGISDNITYMRIGNQRISVVDGQGFNEGIYVFENIYCPRFFADISIPKHPQTSTHKYMNLSPASEFYLHFQPFGILPLDSTKIYDLDAITCEFIVDYTTGISTLRVKTNEGNDNSILTTATAEYGVDIPISTLVTDLKTSIGIGIANIITNNFIPSESNAAGQLLSKIGVDVATNSDVELMKRGIDIFASALGQIQSTGASGSFIAYRELPFVYAYYYAQVEHDINRFGSPLHDIRRIGNVSGFCLCKNATMEYNYGKPLLQEKNEILHYLNTGFYIE